jgi:hypothetical protein
MQLPGALALAAAGAATQANGATVQISFANNMVSFSTVLANFVPDLTGDGVNDVGGYLSSTSVSISNALNSRILGQASMSDGSVFLGTHYASSTSRMLVPFTFSDARINNSVVTSGFLDMEGWAGEGVASLKIHRLIFDDASTTAPIGLTSASTGIAEWSAVPEPSSLGLLALGAGGLLARRRRAA